MAPIENVLVLGGSYSGARAAELLAQKLPKTHRVVLIDRQSHFNHLYLFPRYGVVPSHAHKAFIPLHRLLASPPPSASPEEDPTTALPSSESADEPVKDGAERELKSVVLHAGVVKIGKNYVELDRDLPEAEGWDVHVPAVDGEQDGEVHELTDQLSKALHINGTTTGAQRRRISWTYIIYALGCVLPRPLLSPARTKKEGVNFLLAQQNLFARSNDIVIAGAGALGIQYSCDLADLYNNPAHADLRPEGTSAGKKNITLIHSRKTVMRLYDPAVHAAAVRRCTELGVNLVLGDRVVLPSQEERQALERGEKKSVIRTEGGKEFTCDLFLQCTGQSANSTLMQSLAPTAIRPDGFIGLRPSLQIHPSSTTVTSPGLNTAEPEGGHEEHLDRVFAIGDCTEGGVIKAGHTGWNMSGVAVDNIVKLIKAEQGGKKEELELFKPTPPMIRLTLGLNNSVSQIVKEMGSEELVISESHEGKPESHWKMVWESLKADPSDPHF